MRQLPVYDGTVCAMPIHYSVAISLTYFNRILDGFLSQSVGILPRQSCVRKKGKPLAAIAEPYIGPPVTGKSTRDGRDTVALDASCLRIKAASST